MIDEVVAPMEKFKEILGVTPKYFRPPYGEMDLRLKAILEQTGLIALRWNFDSFDAQNATVQQSVDRFVGAMKTPNQWIYGSPAGDSYIALKHDGVFGFDSFLTHKSF
jgi:peptidoglycan/xylan/chitin deacetylase (PgdA/CDA1 family)